MRYIIAVEQFDGERVWVNANAAAVKQSVHGRRKRQHVAHVIDTAMGRPERPDMGTVNRKRTVRHYEPNLG